MQDTKSTEEHGLWENLGSDPYELDEFFMLTGLYDKRFSYVPPHNKKEEMAWGVIALIVIFIVVALVIYSSI